MVFYELWEWPHSATHPPPTSHPPLHPPPHPSIPKVISQWKKIVRQNLQAMYLRAFLSYTKYDTPYKRTMNSLKTQSSSATSGLNSQDGFWSGCLSLRLVQEKGWGFTLTSPFITCEFLLARDNSFSWEAHLRLSSLLWILNKLHGSLVHTHQMKSIHSLILLP